MKKHKNFLQLLEWNDTSNNENFREIFIISVNEDSDSDCSVLSAYYKNIKINSLNILKLTYNSMIAQFNNWLVNLKTDFDEDPARFSTSHQKIILISIMLDEQLKTMFNSAAKDTLILFYHWWKFKNWLQDVVLYEDSDKLKLLKEFIAAHQLLKKDLNQFYLRLFNLEIQFKHVISIKDYWTRLLKFLQNLMNQHDHKYLTIQNVIAHAGKLWQILNRDKVHQELKKDRKKTQHQHESFDQHQCDNFKS